MKPLKKSDQLLLLEKVHRLSQAGIPQKSIANQLVKYGAKRISPVGKYCLEVLGNGQSISSGLAPFITRQALLAIKGGENGGDITQGFADAIASLELTEASTGSLIKVLVKPVLGIITIAIVSVLVSTQLFPSLAEQLPKARWGLLASLADAIGQFFLDWGTLLLIIGVLGGAGIAFFIGRYTGSGRGWLDILPVFKQYRYIQATNLLITVAHQVQLGIPIRQALESYREHSTPYLQHHIQMMLGILGSGQSNIGDVLDTGLLANNELDSIKILSEVSNTAQTLEKSAHMHTTQLLKEIDGVKKYGTIISKIVTYSIGGILIFGIITLVFSIAGTAL